MRNRIQTTVSRDKAVKMYGWLYAAMVAMVSYTAFYSPFVSDKYTMFILTNSIILWLTSYYIVGFKQLKNWFNDRMKEAKYRTEFRRAVEKEVDKKMEEYRKGY